MTLVLKNGRDSEQALESHPESRELLDKPVLILTFELIQRSLATQRGNGNGILGCLPTTSLMS